MTIIPTPFGGIEVVVSPYIPLETDAIGPGVAPEPYRRERVLGFLIDQKFVVNPENYEEFLRHCAVIKEPLP